MRRYSTGKGREKRMKNYPRASTIFVKGEMNKFVTTKKLGKYLISPIKGR